jgi:hypothetical protein
MAPAPLAVSGFVFGLPGRRCRAVHEAPTTKETPSGQAYAKGAPQALLADCPASRLAREA